MHGMIGVAQRNRRGRKRKQRVTLANKPVVEVKLDYRAMAALQPHRVILPVRWRDDPRAGTQLGNLLLTGKLAPHDRKDGKPSEEALQLFRAGQNFIGVVNAYRAVISPPRASAGAMGAYACKGEEYCDVDGKCECVRRTREYNDAHAALKGIRDSIFGQAVLKVVSRTVVYDEPCAAENVPLLVMGLRALAEMRK